MSLKRYAKSVDGTIPVQALLYTDEDLLASQESVGIYDGPQKSAQHQAGSVYATTYRLFYIDTAHPRSRSFALDLSDVGRTDYYAGLLRSSSKVTLYLRARPKPETATSEHPIGSGTPQSNVTGAEDPVFDSWECEVCSYRNPPGLSPTAARICGLCGVPRSSVKPTSVFAKSSAAASYHLSSSLPSSSLNLPAFGAAAPSSQTSSPESTVDGKTDEEVACPACTFLNHPSLPACEICGTPLPRRPFAMRALHPPAKSAPTSRPITPMTDDDDDDDADSPDKRMIRLSFRKGGDKAFYNVLRRSLLGKAWEGGSSITKPVSAGAPLAKASDTARSGITGILQTVDDTKKTTENNMQDALQDLEALMIKWKDMVRLAQDLNERLTAASTSASGAPSAGDTGPAMITQAVEPEEATFIRSSLAQLGLQMNNTPVTLDMVRDERRWVEELAKELAGILQGQGKAQGMMRRRGIIGLDEVWGGWNRARGVALIPPATFLQVLPQLPSYTSPPIQMRTFQSSGLSVLHTPPYTRAAFASRMVSLLTLAGPKTTVDVAHEEELPIALVQEMVGEVEDAGEICRDESESGVSIPTVGAGRWASGEVRWWVNVFRGYVWDGHEFA
ncbi:hypothetical protein OBBRIDRAFT_795815 [Obba rivulosa]|uniref:Vacuolar protein-sorting-associated protein 36 n=1 Tax=Obba rivulosa TaxID=1052685 RepID=A0A8E2DJG3_9APHY|nr:hypothetical protein OBBRIDRAFT_795815 [Obba rivulosa]